MSKKSGLGKGLHELLAASLGGGSFAAEAVVAPPEQNMPKTTASGEKLLYVDVSAIDVSPYQPRREIDPVTLQELSQSIKVQGVVQPIVVREKTKDRYELVAGERRWRASMLAGLQKIPAVVKVLSEESAMAVALVENIQRENLNPMDEARALKRLSDTFDCTHQEVADAVGKSRTTVTNLLRLLELHEDVQKLLEFGDLEMGHARALLGLPYEMQGEVARTIALRDLSVRETEKLVKKLKDAPLEGDLLENVAADPDVLDLETRLAETLGAKVSIRHGKQGKGMVVIRYHSLDELDGILSHIH